MGDGVDETSDSEMTLCRRNILRNGCWFLFTTSAWNVDLLMGRCYCKCKQSLIFPDKSHCHHTEHSVQYDDTAVI